MLIPWEETIKLCPNITGIIHVGAHKAEERKYYKDIPTRWVEADPALYCELPVVDKFNFAAFHSFGTAKFNRMPFSAANSLLEPNLNAKRRKDVYVEEVIEVMTAKISVIQKPGYNFLNLDIQGAELNALKGCDISLFDYIYTEVHRVHTYKNCTQVQDIDNYLTGFKRIKTAWTAHDWGDAIYIKT